MARLNVGEIVGFGIIEIILNIETTSNLGVGIKVMRDEDRNRDIAGAYSAALNPNM